MADKKNTVTNGFNVPTKDGEKRYEIGDTVKESDFDPKVWKELIKLGVFEEK